MVNHSTLKRNLIRGGGNVFLIAFAFLLSVPTYAQTIEDEDFDQTEKSYDSSDAEARKATSTGTVDLTEFGGHSLNCFARLMWTTALEIEFNYFDLEWSENGISYEKIESIEGGGGANIFSYNFTDIEASNHNYYRLKMVHMDGSYTYSEVVYINTGCDQNFEFEMFPNPVARSAGSVEVKFYSQQEEATVFIQNVNGQVIKQLTIGVSEPKAWNTIRMDVSDLEKGIYFIKISGTKGAKSLMIK